MIKWQVLVAAIMGITIIECVALSNGINGIVLTAVVGVLAAIAGVTIPTGKLIK